MLSTFSPLLSTVWSRRSGRTQSTTTEGRTNCNARDCPFVGNTSIDEIWTDAVPIYRMLQIQRGFHGLSLPGNPLPAEFHKFEMSIATRVKSLIDSPRQSILSCQGNHPQGGIANHTLHGIPYIPSRLLLGITSSKCQVRFFDDTLSKGKENMNLKNIRPISRDELYAGSDQSIPDHRLERCASKDHGVKSLCDCFDRFWPKAIQLH